MVLPTSSPSPLRNSPGFSPDSLRPHRGRTMYARQASTCDTHFATCRPPAPCHRHAGSRAAHASEPTERNRRGTSHPRGNSVRQGTSCHTRRQTPRLLTHLPQRRTDHNTATDRISIPRRAPHTAKSCAPAAASCLEYNFVAEKFCSTAQARG